MRSASADPVRGERLRWPVLTFLALLVVSKLLDVGGPSVGALFVLGCCVIPLWWASGRGRGTLVRLRWWLLAVQAVLKYVPFAVLGHTWIGGMSGFLAGLVLLVVVNPWRWVALAVLVGVELTLWLGVVGLPYQPAANAGPWVVVALLDNAFAFFGLCALADTVADLRRTRGEIADRSVAEVRLSAAAQLRSTVDDRIHLVAAQTRAALRRLSSVEPGGAAAGRAEIAAAAANARAVVAGARAMAHRDADRAVAMPTDTGGPGGPGGTTPLPRLARGAFAGLLAGFAVQNVLNAAFPYRDDVWVDRRAVGVAVAVLVSILVPLLQWRHSTAPAGTRPRHWPATLAVMTVLAFAPFPFVGPEGLVLVTFVSGSILLLVPGRVAWFWFALPQLAALVLAFSGPGDVTGAFALEIVAYATATLNVAVMVFGLSRLSIAAVELHEARRDLAALAVVREQLRLAQDTHDLLGLGLSTLALKADLAATLLDHDTARARRELADMLRVCAAVRADAAGITADTITLSLADELTVAADILAASGVDARMPSGVPDLPPDADALLARVVREAVANVVRHGGGDWVGIEVSGPDGRVTLRIVNDVRTTPPAPRTDGRGLANLEDRLADHGGRLRVTAGDDTFELAVDLPSTATQLAATGSRR